MNINNGYLSILYKDSTTSSDNNRISDTSLFGEGSKLKPIDQEKYSKIFEEDTKNSALAVAQWSRDISKPAFSAKEDFIVGYQGFEKFKEQQAVQHKNLDFEDMDVTLKEGELHLSGIKDSNGNPISQEKLDDIEAVFFEEEELVETLTSVLSDLTKAINTVGESSKYHTSEISNLDNISKEIDDKVIEEGHFSLKGFIDSYNQYFEGKHKHSNVREGSISEGFNMKPTNEAYKTITDRLSMESSDIELFMFIMGHGDLESSTEKNSFINTKA